MFLLRDKFNIQLKTIGEAGNRDHATVSYGIDKIVFMQQNDPLVKNDIEILLKALKNNSFPLLHILNNKNKK